MSAALARQRKQKAKNALLQSSNTASTSSAPLSEHEKMKATVTSLLSSPTETSNYEALQLLSSHVHRHTKAGNTAEALAVAYFGGVVILKYGNVSVASDLCMMYVETLVDCRIPQTPERIAEILEISSRYKGCYAPLNATVGGADVKKKEAHVKFLKGAIHWSAALGSTLYGSMELHEALGMSLYECKEYLEGVTHLAFAEKPELIGEKLFESGANGLDSGFRDTFISSACLIFLTLENMRDANLLVNYYKTHTATTRKSPPPREVVMITWLLQIALRSNSASSMYKWLLSSFQGEIGRHEKWTGWMAKIGSVYFGIKPPMGQMEQIMSMFGGGGK